MGFDDDVIVVGGGLAGMTAALTAARHADRVRVITHKQSTLRSATGLIDVLGYTPEGSGPVSNPFSVLPDLPEGHPYERVGESAIEAGLALFDDIATEYEGGHTRRNALLPTHIGTIKPTARYPRTMSGGLASDSRDMLLVGFRTLTDFDAPYAAARLARVDPPFTPRGVTVEFPGGFRADAKITRFAHALDANESVATARGSETTRAALAATVKARLDDEERVGFPAVLGETATPAVHGSLQDHLGVEVFEVPMGPPSLPGIRLEAMLRRAMDAAGVRRTAGNPVVEYSAEGGTIRSVTVDREGRRVAYHAEQFVLATGGLVGKGIDSARDRVFEPVFDCHVPHPSDRYAWFADDAFGEHRFARFGVDVDGELRPCGPNGEPEFENLRAAGAVLGGADFAAEKSGSGISLSTGVVAGRAAGTFAADGGGSEA